MKKILIGCLCLLLVSCNEKLDTQLSLEKNRTLLVIGLDHSKTFKAYNRLTPLELENFCKTINTNKEDKTAILVGVIGNPNPNSFLKCTLHAIPIIDKSLTLTQQRIITVKAKKKRKLNQFAIRKFIKKYEGIYKKPHTQYTDLDDFFRKANLVLNESQYQDYNKSLFLFSDGEHSVKGNEQTTPVNPNEFKGVQFYTTGLKNKKLFKAINYQEYVSCSAFFENFLTFKK